MTKTELEAVLNTTSIKPVYRTDINGESVYIADGFVPVEHFPFLYKFGVTATQREFPTGVYATMWYSERKVGGGGMCLCDALHDPEDSKESRQNKRIKAATERAREQLTRRKH